MANKNLTGNEIRKMFLDYFRDHAHMIEPGASLVPINDPTLLWINSGVAALKKYLDGREKPQCNRIANAQKCIRTNDIENVGKTSRHHTFFEMLGNWSIGDYFKEESLKMSWEFLTSEKYIGFDPERIYVTVYPDDTESYDIWTKEIGLNPSHILKSYDNFWQIGEGPCGPDSEIYYDRGPKYDPEGIGERLFFEEMENDRYVELWNNVFSQYDAKEGVDRKDFKELPQKNIDTGMGLERLVAMVQDGETNFDTDLFLPYIREVEKYTNVKYEDNKMAFRVIADHIRTCVFALSDGATFSNEGRGYVLRRVLRRAMRYARNIGIEKPFLYDMVDVVCENMKDFYPYLMEKKDFVKKLIRREEESFIQTLANGEKLLAAELDKVDNGVLSGEVIFKLYDTYGFPKEMTIESAEDKGIKCDMEGFEKCMARQKEMARNAREDDQSMSSQSLDLLNLDTPFTFTGYEKLTDEAKVVALFENGNKVDEISGNGEVVFDHSCFYATSGGQVADTGLIFNDSVKAEVKDVSKAPNGQFLHKINVTEGTIKVGDTFKLEVNAEDRLKIKANHSSLHLLQSALRKVVGNHVAQAGSYVCKDYARFDFSHFEKISDEDLGKIEKLVNTWICSEYPVTTQVLDLEEAKKLDAIALFDEKYGDKVRVVSMGDVSTEFCGGTHASNTSDLGSFRIVSEESVGSGIRRIECCTKIKAYEEFKTLEAKLNALKDELKLKNIDMIYDRLVSLKNENASLNSELKTIKEKLINEEANSLISKAKDNGKYKYLLLSLDKYDGNLKDYATSIRNKLNGGFVFVVNKNEDRLSMVAGAGKDAIDSGIKCGEIISKACALANGKGGGKPDLAQGGGSNADPEMIIAEVENLVK
ncbi:MAG: alanine--tRNA ligase [Erysipelotrichaceae bacterium]|nr:alanine--tRNA ligase [Erysipelotrichaceae bacterium]